MIHPDISDSEEVRGLKREMSQLEKERDFWRGYVREELAGSYYSEGRVDFIMGELEKEVKK